MPVSFLDPRHLGLANQAGTNNWIRTAHLAVRMNLLKAPLRRLLLQTAPGRC